MAVMDKPDTTSDNAGPAANAPGTNEPMIDVTNPITGAVIGQVPEQSAEAVVAAVERARAAQRPWAARSVQERVDILRHWGDLMWADQQRVMRIVRDETGKTDAGAFAEVVLVDAHTTYYTSHAPQLLATQSRSALIPIVQQAHVHYQPHGVVGVISPWNYPLMLPLWDALAALIAGNAVVIKPSEITPFSTLRGVEQMHRAGVPTDVVQVVTGRGATGAALVDTVDYVSFTGSTATGRKIAARAAERLIPCSLELGGKDAMLVLADANLELAAAEMIKGGFESAGQACASVERVYVESSVYDDFLGRTWATANRLVVGAGDGFGVDVGSMTNRAEFERTEAHIADALAKGAHIVWGGQPRPDLGPLFYEPTILANCNHSMEVMREETFGPVVAIMRVANAEEAVRLANDSRYGLNASVFTSDLERGERIARQLNVGAVAVNRVFGFISSVSLPWGGGGGESGLGRRAGPEGLMRFVKPQSVALDTQVGLLPAQNMADSITITAFRTMRALRRRLPGL